MKQTTLFLLMIIVLKSSSGLALAGDTKKGNTDGKDFAKSLNSSTINDLGKNVDPTTVPGYQGADVPEQDYYDSGLNIESEAHTKAASDPTAQYMNDSINDRPNVTIDPETDPLFKRFEEITDSAHGLSDTYTGCVDLPVGAEDTPNEIKTCGVAGIFYYDYPECHRTYDASCRSAYNAPYTKTVTIKAGSAGQDYFTAKVNLGANTWEAISPSDGRNQVVNFPALSFDEVCKDKTTKITHVSTEAWKEAPSAVGGGSFDGSALYRVLQHPSCSNGLVGKYQLEDKSKGPDYKWVLGAKFTYSFRVESKCTPEFTEKYSCDVGGGYTSSQLDSRSCVYSGYRMVNGFNIYKDCWDWKEIFKIQKIRYEEEEKCQELRDAGCGYVRRECKSFSPEGYCLYDELTHSCPTNVSARHVSMCGSQLVCPGGNCTEDIGQTYQPATEDFKKAATGMAVASEIAKGMNMDDLTVFTGKDLRCSKGKASFKNCCKDSGWGTDAGLAKCDAEEKELSLQKEAKQVHYVGSYCADRFGNSCLSTKYVYCAYPSKLARIVIEQGKAQLKKKFGTARTPICSGFSLQELESLNFDAMNFKEFYSDVMDNAENGSTPSESGAAQDIRDKINQRFPQIE